MDMRFIYNYDFGSNFKLGDSFCVQTRVQKSSLRAYTSRQLPLTETVPSPAIPPLCQGPPSAKAPSSSAPSIGQDGKSAKYPATLAEEEGPWPREGPGIGEGAQPT